MSDQAVQAQLIVAREREHYQVACAQGKQREEVLRFRLARAVRLLSDCQEVIELASAEPTATQVKAFLEQSRAEQLWLAPTAQPINQ